MTWLTFSSKKFFVFKVTNLSFATSCKTKCTYSKIKTTSQNNQTKKKGYDTNKASLNKTKVLHTNQTYRKCPCKQKLAGWKLPPSKKDKFISNVYANELWMAHIRKAYCKINQNKSKRMSFVHVSMASNYPKCNF